MARTGQNAAILNVNSDGSKPPSAPRQPPVRMFRGPPGGPDPYQKKISDLIHLLCYIPYLRMC